MKRQTPRPRKSARSSVSRQKIMIGKRTIFDEIMEGVQSMKKHREGKITLRTYKVEPPQLPKVDSRGNQEVESVASK